MRMTQVLIKPKYLGVDHAAKFKYASMAQAYQLRPPYPQEVYDTLLNMIADTPRTVLDVGCGPGKIALGLVADIDRVDAVDFSEAMIQAGKLLPRGNSANLRWICGSVETIPLHPPYALITAGASLHWMDWDVVFPRFKEMLTPRGMLAIIEGDLPINSPWSEEEKLLIRKYSTNTDYQPFDWVGVLIRSGYLHKHGEKYTQPVVFEQPVEEYVESFHSRESMCKEVLGKDRTQAFDEALKKLLSPYTKSGGITFETQVRIIWGRPT